MATSRKGIFVVLEGGEGVGKTTQIKLLKERLPLLYPDREIVFTREPGGSEYGEEIRQLIFSKLAEGADGKTMIGLFMAGRTDHVSRIIKPALNAGKIVICDRFVAATYAYQVIAMDKPASYALFHVHYAELDAHPDRTIILDMEPERALDRLLSRKGETTHFDTRPLEFHKKLRDGYQGYARLFPKTSVLLDADRGEEEVYEDLIEKIASVIAE